MLKLVVHKVSLRLYKVKVQVIIQNILWNNGYTNLCINERHKKSEKTEYYKKRRKFFMFNTIHINLHFHLNNFST